MTNRTVLVTGASRGIGRACALALAETGARVAVAARNVEQLESLAGEIRARSREAFVVVMDLADPESIQRFVAEFPEADALRLRELVAAAQKEHAAERPPRHFRELFHVLNALLQDSARRQS